MTNKKINTVAKNTTTDSNSSATDVRPQTNNPCCNVWSKIQSRFQWMVFDDFPELLVMPHIDDGENKWFVNYCPSCGAKVRNMIIEEKNLLTV